jgi:hypothetical protein
MFFVACQFQPLFGHQNKSAEPKSMQLTNIPSILPAVMEDVNVSKASVA